MNLALFATTLLMSVAALAFVVTPLVRVQRTRSTGSVNLSLLGILVVFGLGIALYAAIGRPGVASHDTSNLTSRTMPENSQADANNSAQREKVGSVASLLTGLEARLDDNPDDGKGWLLLAQSYELLGRMNDAKAAYDKATALGINDDEFASRLADIPNQAKNPVTIRGRVSVSPEVADKVTDDAVVYVIAKTAENPMPLAVLRRSAGELPFDFELSDANSMVQGVGLSADGELTIAVGISSSGDALAMDEGLETAVSGVDPNVTEKLDITIGKNQAQ